MVFIVAYQYSKSVSIIECDMYIYIYMSRETYVEFLASHFSDISRCLSKFTGWAMIEELSIRRRLRTFVISLGHKTRAKHFHINLSL